MEQRPFGNAKLEVPVIGMGTWYIDEAERAAAMDALRRGIDLGMTHIDTAEMYGSGGAEQVIAKAMEGRRSEIYLVSKVLPSNATTAGVVKACEATLKRLKTDHLDCYLLHWRGSYDLAHTGGGLEEMVGAGQNKKSGARN